MGARPHTEERSGIALRETGEQVVRTSTGTPGPRGSRAFARIILSTALTAVGLAVGLVPVGAAPAFAAGTGTLQVTIAPVTTPIPSGTSAQWAVNYSCSGLTANDTCDLADIAVSVAALSPGGNAVTFARIGSVGDGNFAATATGFTAIAASIANGATGQLIFAGTPANLTTPDQSTLIATATYSPGGTATQDVTATPIVVTAKPLINVHKALLGDSVLDTPTAYDITGTTNPGLPAATGTWQTQNPVLVDTLPPGAVFVSASDGGVYDAAAGTVTWTAATSPSLLATPMDERVHVIYPSAAAALPGHPFFTAADTVTNNVTLSATTVTDPAVVSAHDSVTHGFTAATGGSGTYSKTVVPNYNLANAILKDATFSWAHSVKNTGGVPIGGTIYDYPPCNGTGVPIAGSLPQDCTRPDFTITKFTGIPAGSVVTLYLSDGSSKVITTTASQVASLSVASLGLSAGTVVGGYSITLASGSVDPASTLVVLAYGTLTDPAAYQSVTQTNCGAWSISDAPAAALGASSMSCPIGYFKAPFANLAIRKRFRGGPNALLAGQVAPWDIRVENDGASASPDYLDAPVKVVDTLPSTVTYVPGSATVVADPGGLPYDADFTTADLTVTQSGQQLTFTFPPGTLLDRGKSFVIDYSTTINAGVGAGSWPNTAQVYDPDDPAWDIHAPGTARISTATVPTGSSTQVSAQKLVEGDQDSGLLASSPGSPAIGTSQELGDSTWQLKIGSLGSTPISDLVLYDIFPYVGDTGVSGTLASAARQSQFQPVLDGPLTLPAGVVATYSMSTNPCRPEVYPGQGACVNDWTSTPTDWSLVRAVRISSSKTYQPGQIENVDYTMAMPADATPGEIAWNSLAYAASGPNGALLPSEPAKVGIRISPMDLSLTKTLVTTGTLIAGQTVTFSLVPHNNGPSPASAGWSVSDQLPTGLSFVSASGAGYDCTRAPVGPADVTCVADGPLASGSDGSPVTVTATIVPGATGTLRNESWIAPAAIDGPETNPLVIPPPGTDTTTTPTNNDAHADVAVTPAVSIGDHVWQDNGDGIQQPGEPGIDGVTVTLLEADGTTPATDVHGNPVMPVTTNASGFYSFTDLPAGHAYRVKFTRPAGFLPAPQETGTDPLLDSNPDATGLTPVFTTPASGTNSSTSPDDPSIDAGFVLPIDLSLSKTLLTHGSVSTGQTVEFSLVPHNNGPGEAISGWSVSDQLPAGLSFVSAAGAGYDCTGTPSAPATVTCVAASPLAAKADSAPITVTATITATRAGSLRNESWVAPAATDVPETNPLVIPPPGTDTTTTPTNNDAHADVTIAAPHPGVAFDKRVEKTVDVNKNGYLDVNDEIFYEFLVTNTGNVPLTGVVVTDGLLTRSGITVTCIPDALDPGQSVMCKSSGPYLITKADVARGVVVNAAMVRVGEPRDGMTVHDHTSTPVGPPHVSGPHDVLPNTGMPEFVPGGGVAGLVLVMGGAWLIRRSTRRRENER